MIDRPLRLAVVQSHPIQYFSPLFRELAARTDVNLTVLYCSRVGVEQFVDAGFGVKYAWTTPLLGGYECEFVPNVSGFRFPGSMLGLINPGIIRRLLAGRFDAVMIHGYNYFTYWLVFGCCVLFGIPILMRGESNLLHPRPLFVRWLKELLLRPLFKCIAACFYIGEENRKYFKYYGMKDGQLFHTPYSVDNDYFRSKAIEYYERRSDLKRKMKISAQGPVIVFAGKLIEKKQPLLLLRAFARVRAKYSCSLLFAGDGPLRRALEDEIAKLAVQDVVITGFLNQNELPEAYGSGDIFVLPSIIEPWGLVVNEAMNFGLPIIVSDRVGCAADLIRSAGNGFVVGWDDEEGLSTAIESLVANPDLRVNMGRHSREVIAGWGIPETADGILKGLLTTVRQRKE